MDLFKEKKIPSEVQFPLLMNININNNVQYNGFNKYFIDSYDNYPAYLKEKFRIEIYNLIKKYMDEDGYFTVYRGEYTATDNSSIKINQAISFTFDYEKALFFACRRSPKKANIYTTKVTFDNILYFSDERNEKEVLLRPENKGGKFLKLECSELKPEEYYNKSIKSVKYIV
jgi:hypothetical protein